MKYYVTILIMILGTSNVFASEPPSEFLGSDVTSNFGTNNITSYGFTVKQLTDAYKDSAKTSWNKDGKNWIFKIDRTDKVTDKLVRISMTFEPYDNGKAFMVRWVIDDESLTQKGISAMLMRVRNDFFSAGILKDKDESVAAGKKTNSVKKSQAKPTTKAPEPENLSKGMKGSYVQEFAEDANSSAFSVEEVSVDSVRLKATAPNTCNTILMLKKGFAQGQVFAKSADVTDLKFEVQVNDGDVKFQSRRGPACSGPCCEFSKDYLRQ